jgi:hypothetical protein
MYKIIFFLIIINFTVNNDSFTYRNITTMILALKQGVVSIPLEQVFAAVFSSSGCI